MSVRDKLSVTHYRGEIEFDIDEHTADQVVARMPVKAGMVNPFGTVHAGAMIWFADIAATLCAIGDLTTVDDTGRGFPLAVDLHTVLAGNRRDGTLTATARPVKRGKAMTVIRTEVTAEDGTLLISLTSTHVSAR